MVYSRIDFALQVKISLMGYCVISIVSLYAFWSEKRLRFAGKAPSSSILIGARRREFVLTGVLQSLHLLVTTASFFH